MLGFGGGPRRRAGSGRRGVSAVGAAAIVAAVLIPGAGTAVAAEEPAPVVFILDASGSMVREISPGVSRMDVAKQATIATLESLPAGAQVGMLVFGTGTGNADAERAAGCTDITTLAGLGTVDSDALSAKVRAVKESGFTPLGPALREAAEMLPSGGAGQIVLVSDGVDTCSPPSSCQVAAELHRANPQLAIHTVAFGVDDDEAAQQQLTCIGSVGGGTAVLATDPEQLTARLRAAGDVESATRLGLRGFEGVELGMNLDEVRARVDGADVGSPQTRDGVVVVLVDCGWGTVELRDNRVVAITPKDASTPTTEGITPGDTLDAATALYGPAVDDDTTADGPSAIYQAAAGSPVGYRMVYDPATRTIRYIVVCRCVPWSALSGGVADWEVTFDGVGPLRLGMSTTEATAAVPQLVQGRSADRYEIPGTGDDPALTADFLHDALVHIAVGQAWVDTPVNGSRLPHARGIRVGESASIVQNAFPGGTYQSYVLDGVTAYIVSDREGRTLAFAVLGSSTFSEAGMAEWFSTSALGAVTVEDAAVTRSDGLYGG